MMIAGHLNKEANSKEKCPRLKTTFRNCEPPDFAHTPPKLDSYKHSYQTWGHAPGQPALKGSSYSNPTTICTL